MLVSGGVWDLMEFVGFFIPWNHRNWLEILGGSWVFVPLFFWELLKQGIYQNFHCHSIWFVGVGAGGSLIVLGTWSLWYVSPPMMVCPRLFHLSLVQFPQEFHRLSTADLIDAGVVATGGSFKQKDLRSAWWSTCIICYNDSTLDTVNPNTFR